MTRLLRDLGFRKKAYLMFMSFYAVFASSATWATMKDASSQVSIRNTLIEFNADVGTLVTNIQADASMMGAVDMLWNVFASTLIITACVKHMYRGLTLEEIMNHILMLGFTQVFLKSYNLITSAIWRFFEGFASGIQRVAFPGSSDLLMLSGFVNDILNRTIYTNGTLWSLSVGEWIAIGIMQFMGFLMGVLTVFATMWGVWGYAVAKIIGMLFIPTLLFERLTWMFDGWLRFFFSFMVYVVVARINLVLVGFVIMSFYNLTAPVAPTIPPTFSVNVAGAVDVLALGAFFFIGILALISTGQFAGSIVSGASGMGSGLRSLVMIAGGKGLKK